MTRDLMMATLIEGLDDWVPVLTIYSLARRLNPEIGLDVAREIVIDTARELLDQGLAEAGTVTEASGYIPLRESVPAVVDRIRNAFIEDDDPEMWGYVIWLNNTAGGRCVGEPRGIVMTNTRCAGCTPLAWR
jgi:hypothetical protein